MPPPVRHKDYVVFDFPTYLQSHHVVLEELAVAGFRRWPMSLGIKRGCIGRERRPGVVAVRERTWTGCIRVRNARLRDGSFLRNWVLSARSAAGDAWNLARKVEASAPSQALVRSYVASLVRLHSFGYAKDGLSLERVIELMLRDTELNDSTRELVSGGLLYSAVTPHFLRLEAAKLRLAASLAREGLPENKVLRFIKHRAYLESVGLLPASAETPDGARRAAEVTLSRFRSSTSVQQALRELSANRRASKRARELAMERLNEMCGHVLPSAEGEPVWREFLAWFVDEEELRRLLLLRAQRNLRAIASNLNMSNEEVSIETLCRRR